MANIDKQGPSKSLDGKQKPSLTDNTRVQTGKEDGGMRDTNLDRNEQRLSDDELDEDLEDIDDGDVDSRDDDAAQTDHDDN